MWFLIMYVHVCTIMFRIAATVCPPGRVCSELEMRDTQYYIIHCTLNY